MGIEPKGDTLMIESQLIPFFKLQHKHEKEILMDTLNYTQWNIKKTATILEESNPPSILTTTLTAFKEDTLKIGLLVIVLINSKNAFNYKV